MMLAPLRTNLMAPLSTCWCGRMKGSVKRKREFITSVRKTQPRRSVGIRWSYIYATVWGWGRMVLLSVWRTAALRSLSGFQCVHGCGKNNKYKNSRRKSTILKTHSVTRQVIPSHYFDRVLLWHYVIEPWLDVGKLFQQLIFDAFDHWCFQLDTVGHIFLLIKSETGNRTNFCVMSIIVKIFYTTKFTLFMHGDIMIYDYLI